MTARTAGFTLIELLVALALGLVILLVASDLLISSSRSASDLQGRNDLLQESQIAQNYMVAQLREAAYVFPEGTTLALGAGATTTPPGESAWRVGDDTWPVVAVVRPPRRVGTPCVLPSGVTDPDACYQFLAYYPLPRDTWVGAVSGADDPGPDAANGGRWVLVEYRSTYPAAPPLSLLPGGSGGAYTPPPGGAARLLLDYVQPPALALPGTPPLFTVTNLNGGPWRQTPGDISVTVNLAVSRRIGRQDVTVPNRGADAAGSVTTVGTVPRNLGKLPN
ncbi:prepilin-type N-terminal cleavage/methylation domain-containing protein [Deinococcus metalli]|uniref:Prepilin-type N-terminal cleavage/methylation domain-containing protein n=1 Tax=Deinococcus metalli TaxID=1141878 RepID=A0A7W8NRG1_9DEIO|nr:prepilin-type N-terminal cleavage/methylation domain-containing protein [Deinococcus metalli]MBB5376848.1 prepilin-type N-terminal cleavage/methylation domain-containing protein [Deinococcus metalli]GHF45817.1 hypothetical protein GCM10017781_22770 [Deinococcus metalli]